MKYKIKTGLNSADSKDFVSNPSDGNVDEQSLEQSKDINPKEKKRKIYNPIPNNSISQAINKLSDLINKFGTEDNIEGLWPHQKQCIYEISKNLSQGINIGYVKMATGTGKTRVFSTLIKHTETSTLIVTSRDFLIDQIAETITKTSPNLDVGIVDGKRKSPGRNVTLTTYESFVNMSKKGALKDIKLIILDEVHAGLATTRVEAIRQILLQNSSQLKIKDDNANYLVASPVAASYSPSPESELPIIIGFTATDRFNTFRRKGSLRGVEELLINKFFEYNIEQGIDDKILSPVKIVTIELDQEVERLICTNIRGKKKKQENSEVEISAAELEVLNDDRINNIIADFIKNVRDPENAKVLYNLPTIIFSVNIDHANRITDRLNKSFNDSNYAISIHCKMHPRDKKEALEGFKSGKYKALVNVDVASTGLDIPKVGAVIDFRPTGSMVNLTQRFGRITRIDPDLEFKIYVQLVLNGCGQIVVSDMFNNKLRLGEIKDVASSAEFIDENDHLGKHFYYKVTFSNKFVVERGNKLQSSEDVNIIIKPIEQEIHQSDILEQVQSYVVDNNLQIPAVFVHATEHALSETYSELDFLQPNIEWPPFLQSGDLNLTIPSTYLNETLSEVFQDDSCLQIPADQSVKYIEDGDEYLSDLSSQKASRLPSRPSTPQNGNDLLHELSIVDLDRSLPFAQSESRYWREYVGGARAGRLSNLDDSKRQRIGGLE